MQIVNFIRANLEPILQAWEDFADSIPHQHMDKTALRDHAREMLLEIVEDLESSQSEAEQVAKSKGHEASRREKSWAEVHGGDRQGSGFSIVETVSEFRALGASAVSLWTNSNPRIDEESLMALTRFHEAIDQDVTRSLEQYSTIKDKETRAVWCHAARIASGQHRVLPACWEVPQGLNLRIPLWHGRRHCNPPAWLASSPPIMSGFLLATVIGLASLLLS